jgi:hypothetical protein
MGLRPGIGNALFVLVALLASAMPCLAYRAHERSTDRPCIANLCVGGDLHEMLDLPWNPIRAKTLGADESSIMARIESSLRGARETTATVMRYWEGRLFDADGLAALDSLDAVCEDIGVWWRPRASLIDQHGEKVSVAFEPVVEPDDGSTALRIATISVEFSKTLSPDRMLRRREELMERFAAYQIYPSATEPGVRWITRSDGILALKLFAPLGDVKKRARSLPSQSDCAAMPR